MLLELISLKIWTCNAQSVLYITLLAETSLLLGRYIIIYQITLGHFIMFHL